MRRSIFVLLAVAIACTGLAALPSPASAPSKFDADLLRSDVSPRAIVGFSHDVDRSTIKRLSRAGITHAAVLTSIDAAIVTGPIAVYRAIATWTDVTYVDADSRIRLDNNGAKNDTRASNVRAGHRPLPRKYTGKGVTVAVIDSGIDGNHPDFAGRIARHVNFEFTWFVDNIQDGEYTDQFAETTGNAIDDMGHGTHVAGTVGGSGAGGKGADFSGVAPGVTFVNLKITDAHEGLLYDLGFEANALLAYEWMIRNRKSAMFPGGIRIASNSWAVVESDDEVEPMVLMVKEAYRRGIVNVFSAGNSGPDPDTVNEGPGRLEEAITVGAVCKVSEYEELESPVGEPYPAPFEAAPSCKPGEIADFSSRGKQVDIVAPGAGIWSALAKPTVLTVLTQSFMPPPGKADPAAAAQNATNYYKISGTSMSAPHVSGIVALMLEANPKLTPWQVESILIKTARDRGKKGFDPDYGWGAADAFAAVNASIPKPVKKRR